MWAVLPVKSLCDVKTRLAPCLSQVERSALFRNMVEDVICAVSAVPSLAGVLVVSKDPEIITMSRSYGATVLSKHCDEGHTAAVAAALHWLMERGEPGFMQIPGDIPTVTSVELSDVLAVHASSGQTDQVFTISPSHDYDGSNCIVCNLPNLVALKFGPNSFKQHLARAHAAGLEVRVVERPGIALDIDYPNDLERLLSSDGTTRAYRYLQNSGIARRLASKKRSA